MLADPNGMGKAMLAQDVADQTRCMAHRQVDLLFKRISRRYELTRTIATTNKPFASRSEMSQNATCVVLLVDRPVCCWRRRRRLSLVPACCAPVVKTQVREGGADRPYVRSCESTSCRADEKVDRACRSTRRSRWTHPGKPGTPLISALIQWPAVSPSE